MTLIDLEHNATAHLRDETYGSSESFGQLYRLLLATGGFGPDVTTRSQVASLIYEERSAVRNDKKPIDTSTDDNRLSGDHRLANLIRRDKKASVTHQEANFFMPLSRRFLVQTGQR